MLHAYGHASLFQTCCYRYHACGPVSCRALREGRNFALYEDNTLLAVTVYKRGAEAVQRALEARDTVIAEQAARIERLMAAPKSPGPNHSTPAPTRYRDRVRRGQTEQLGFFSSEQKEHFTTERRGSSRDRS